jgi:hypothetical protein
MAACTPARVTCSTVVRYWATGTIGTSASGPVIGPRGGGESDGPGPGDPAVAEGDDEAGDPTATEEPLGTGLAPGGLAPHPNPETAIASSKAPTATTTGRRFTDPILAQKNAPSGRADGA